MAYTEYTPEYYKTKLYQREREFKKFEKLDEEDLAELAKRIYHKQENRSVNSYFHKDKLTNYMETIKYLTNPQIHMELKTYDERIAYLIMATDPELNAFKEFLKVDITSSKKINDEKDENTKKSLITQRESEILGLQSKIREKIGFYDSKLIKYEEVFFYKFICQRELITDVKKDFISKALYLVNFVTSFNRITDERYEELKEKAELWKTITNKDHDLFTSAYNSMNQAETIGLKSTIEQLVFMVLTADPNLDCLRIYEEESMIQETKRRCTELFNYFDMNLVELEKLYHARFCPEQKLSPWTL